MQPLHTYQAKVGPIVPWSSVPEGTHEMATLFALAERLECSESDAIDILTPWSHLVRDAFRAGVDPVETARMVDERSRGQ